MPLFEITKPMTATLIVDCDSEEEAENWKSKIVGDIEDINGNWIESDKIISFEVDSVVSEVKIERLTENEFAAE